jgi:hypothetical protein
MEDDMDNPGDDFIQAFSAKLPEFFDFFTKWWVFDKAINHSDEKYDMNEVVYWYFVWNFAKQKMESFAKTLPKEVKNFVESKIETAYQ